VRRSVDIISLRVTAANLPRGASQSLKLITSIGLIQVQVGL